ncbi:hypothetical protein EVAR_66457_1 [Eumeta japonica]|uniref:Uncharacterized protein n=1 Tax=Eumeta variegata TaxID=151549 RepID=A0A4C1ZYK5_EUMVA|nr:hypothetical protein EVAR_66457_1 [Eumeta japonica]
MQPTADPQICLSNTRVSAYSRDTRAGERSESDGHRSPCTLANSEELPMRCQPLGNRISNKRGSTEGGGLLQHCDNASAHVAVKIRDFLDGKPI